jgi:16S rRNA (guanine527-N7)-methyltransferase
MEIVSSALGGSVSRETEHRLNIVAAQLLKWQPHINLVSPRTMSDYQTRHFRDSLQLCDMAPLARRWIDLGSGGGFPGLVVASVLADHPDSAVVLVESNAKKCAFLRETARLAALPVTVICGRIEDVLSELAEPFDVVSARALAPLDRLFALSEPVFRKGAVGIFPKGQDVDEEVQAALRAWNFSYDLIQSQTERKARIVKVLSLSPRPAS